ncbi:hypothetical protein MNBD_BACTEROID01-2946 [hydrothermal vent metagenome]|uniref:Uncharacterized protein n=1 Tax=hydrothermal vent metagenome TaxID=652676 RepID=A0A3B0U1W9_9ZZZZ
MNYYSVSFCQIKQFRGEYNTVFNDKLLKDDGKRRIINVKDNF